MIGMVVSFDLRGQRYSGELIKNNHYTVWVKVRSSHLGARIIKRHKWKHHVLGNEKEGLYV
jgi:hypothetical protein